MAPLMVEDHTDALMSPHIEDDDTDYESSISNHRSVMASPLHETYTLTSESLSAATAALSPPERTASFNTRNNPKKKRVSFYLPKDLPKRVSFGQFVNLQEVLSRRNYTHEELRLSWYDVDEVRCMRGLARSEAKLVERGILTSENSTDISIRGLEARTRAGSKRKKEIRANSYASVFLEIDYQKEEGIVDEEAIAEAYFVYSMTSSATARRIAKKDEAESRKSWNIPRHLYRSRSYLLLCHQQLVRQQEQEQKQQTQEQPQPQVQHQILTLEQLKAAKKEKKSKTKTQRKKNRSKNNSTKLHIVGPMPIIPQIVVQ